MILEVGDLFEKNGITIQIDWIDKNEVGYAMYRAKIGEMGTIDNFLGWWRKDKKLFEDGVKDAKRR